MLHACVERFDVTDTVGKILGTKRPHTLGREPDQRTIWRVQQPFLRCSCLQWRLWLLSDPGTLAGTCNENMGIWWNYFASVIFLGSPFSLNIEPHMWTHASMWGKEE